MLHVWLQYDNFFFCPNYMSFIRATIRICSIKFLMCDKSKSCTGSKNFSFSSLGPVNSLDHCPYISILKFIQKLYLKPLFSMQKKKRPHIFGMTASPMDNKIGGDLSLVGSFFSTLEANLDSKVFSAIHVLARFSDP